MNGTIDAIGQSQITKVPFQRIKCLQCYGLTSGCSHLSLCTSYLLVMYAIGLCIVNRCGSRIWSRGGPQLLRLKVADTVKWSRTSEVSNLRLGSRALKRALEAFGVLMLKYAFSHILETLFLSFLTSILTPNVDKNRALEFTSINLRHSYILHLFFNLHEKVML